MSLEIPKCCLDLTQGAVLSSDPKRNKPQMIVNFPKSVAGSVFNVFLSTQSKTQSILGQKELKGPMGEEGSTESDKLERYLKTNPKCFFVKTGSSRAKISRRGQGGAMSSGVLFHRTGASGRLQEEAAEDSGLGGCAGALSNVPVLTEGACVLP